MTIFARPGAIFTALLTGAPPDLVGTLTAGIENVDGTTEVPQASSQIVEVEDGLYVATRTAPGDSGDYVFVWENGATIIGEDLRLSEVPPDFPQTAGFIPTVSEVAALLRTRTKPRDGQSELGTFDDTTRPTGPQVEELIEQAVGDVEARTGTVPEALEPRARKVAALYAALLVELSYFPEQINTDKSPYEKLKELYDQALSGLLAAVLGNSPRQGLYSVPLRSEGIPDDAVLP